jgi:hypothetical protein
LIPAGTPQPHALSEVVAIAGGLLGMAGGGADIEAVSRALAKGDATNTAKLAAVNERRRALGVAKEANERAKLEVSRGESSGKAGGGKEHQGLRAKLADLQVGRDRDSHSISASFT